MNTVNDLSITGRTCSSNDNLTDRKGLASTAISNAFLKARSIKKIKVIRVPTIKLSAYKTVGNSPKALNQSKSETSVTFGSPQKEN